MSAAFRERRSRPNMLLHLRARLYAALWLVLTPFFLCLTLETAAGAQGHTTRVSVSSTGAERVGAHDLIPDRVGMFFYGDSGPEELPFGAGTLCVKPPLVRSRPAIATGSGACGGRLSVELNALLGSPDSPFQPSDMLWGQWWSRDPGGTPPADVNLSGGTWFTVMH